LLNVTDGVTKTETRSTYGTTSFEVPIILTAFQTQQEAEHCEHREKAVRRSIPLASL